MVVHLRKVYIRYAYDLKYSENSEGGFRIGYISELGVQHKNLRNRNTIYGVHMNCVQTEFSHLF